MLHIFSVDFSAWGGGVKISRTLALETDAPSNVNFRRN